MPIRLAGGMMNAWNRLGLFALLLPVAALTLAGCADDGTILSTTPPLAGVAVSGSVKSGTTAVSGAHVYLYAVGTGGYGTAAMSLLVPGQTGVTADSSGNGYVTTTSTGTYTIGGDYVCPSSSALVYLLATGGNPGLASGTNNAGLALMEGLGSCGSLTASTVTPISEATTVATAYALAAFATSSTKIASGTNVMGINNSFGLLMTMISEINRAPVAANVGIVPLLEVGSLSNLLATCTGTTSGTSSGCTALFAAAAPTGVTTPTDTVGAILNIAHNPGNNVGSLYTLSLNSTAYGSTPGSGILAAVPNDWTLPVLYTGKSGADFSSPVQVAVDAFGDAWVANQAGFSLTEIGPGGAVVSPLTGPGGYAGPFSFPTGLTIDPNGNVWVANGGGSGGSFVAEFSNTGTVLNDVTPANVANASAIASDASGNIWLTSEYGASSLFELNSAGRVISPTAGYVVPCLAYTDGLAMDVSGNAWMVGANSNCLAETSSTGTVLSNSTGFTGGGIGYGKGSPAVDAAGNIWVPSNNGALSLGAAGDISVFNSAGLAVSPMTGYTSGGIFNPTGVAIDGLGNAWVTNTAQLNAPPAGTVAARISVITKAGLGVTPAAGYLQGVVGATPQTVAIDGSGNVWVPDYANNQVVEMVGAAAPVVTPLSVALKSNTLGARP